MSKILVTGGAGFIGSNFVRYWLGKYPKDSVVVLDALTYAGNKANLADLDPSRLRFVKGNILNKKLVDELVKEVDIVVHFAAESHVDRSVGDPGAFLKTNIWGTFVILEAIKKYDKRFHHVSTDEVYGALGRSEKRKFDESSRYGPRSPYAASKAASDHLVNAYIATYGIRATVSNCANNYGPYHHPEKLIPLFITNLLENKKVPVYGDGGQMRDWLYVEDHCRAVGLIIKKGKLGETYLIGGMTDEITNLELTRKILSLLGRDESMVEYVKDRPGHDQKYAIDWKKIKSLGWTPKYNLEDGLKKTIEWYINNEKWWKKIKNKSFKKYYQKQYGETK